MMQTVKVKETELTATQKKVLQKDHIAYVVEMRSQTLGMPYGDTFALVTRYCITWLSKTSCQLLITCGIDWIKSPGMLKGIIQSNAVKGLQDGLQIEHQILENQVRAGGASGSKVDALKKQKSGARAHWLNLGIFKYQKIVLALLCGILLWFAVLNLISLWRFSSQVSQYALSMNKDRLKVKSWLKEPEYLLSDGSDYKRLFLDSHFYQSNVSDSRLSYAYHNSTKASVYEALKTSHQRAMRRKNRLERQLALVEKIEASSLFAMYENWLLDQASTSSSSS